MRAPRILFLSHSASRNGATILLLHLLRWLKTRVDWDIEVLVNGRGPLVDEFRSIGKTMVWRNPAFFLNGLSQDRGRALRRYLEVGLARTLLGGRRFDLVYANTCAAWPHVEMFANRSPALLWHIHELEYGLRREIGERRMRELFPLATRFVAVSTAVRETLSREFAVPAPKIDLVNGFVAFPSLEAEERRLRRQRVMAELGWPRDAFVVGGCGALGWRKGTDLFLQIAHAVSRTNGYENIRFLWIGGEVRDAASLEFMHDVRKLGLGERCTWLPTTSGVSHYYCAMDVFALTAREDPFPLVMLEAGAHALPVVCFESSGGGPEFVDADAGLIAPYLDINRFATHLMTLHDHGQIRVRLGTGALNKVCAHYGAESQAPKIRESIERCLTIVRHEFVSSSPQGVERAGQ